MTMDEAKLRILKMAEELAGDEQRAATWFEHQPIPGWADKTAYQGAAQEEFPMTR